MSDVPEQKHQSEVDTSSDVVCDPIASARCRIAETIDITADELAKEKRQQRLSEANREKPRRRRARTTLFTIISVLFAASTFYMVIRIHSLGSPQRMTTEEARQYAEECLGMVRSDIEAYRAEYGKYPSSLSDVTIPLDDGIDYFLVEPDNYRLIYKGTGVEAQKMP